MSALRWVCQRRIWVAAHLIVFGSSLVLARYVSLAWPGGATAGIADFYWPVVTVMAGALAFPWLLLAHRRPRGRRDRLRATACGLVGYGVPGAVLAGDLLRGTAAPSPTLMWTSLVLAPGLQAAVLAVSAQRRRRAVACTAGVVVLVLAARFAWSHWDHVSQWGEWIVSEAGAPIASAVLSALLLAGLCGLLAAGKVRWRWAWPLAVVVGLASWPVGWTGLSALQRRSSPRVRIRMWWQEGAPAEPAGLFERVSSEAVVGWHWVRSWPNPCWREALIVQPSCRITGRASLSPDGRLQVFVALPNQRFDANARAVRVHCTAADATGTTVAQSSVVLRVPARDGQPRPWQELALHVSAEAGPEVDVVLEVRADGGDVPGARLPVVAVAGWPVGPPPASARPGPNCIVILVDALRPDRLHCYGFPLETSPHIDQLANQGTLFEWAVATSSCTIPTVASLFTGTYVATHGMRQFQLPGRLALPTLAEHCREAGVRTAAVSANPLILPGSGYGAGFDEFLGSSDYDPWTAPHGDWVTDHAIALMRRLNGQQFFLYLHYMDAHQPYKPPEGWDVFGQSYPELYLGEIRYCDSQIGRLLGELDALGRTDDTLIVLIADHGEGFWEHGCNEHGATLHGEEVHVPLILRLPGHVPAGRRVPALVRSIDVHATIAALMGFAVPRHAEGETLTPFFHDDTAGDREAFGELYQREGPPQHRRWASFNDGRYKLILRLGDGRRQLYDLDRDPEEQTNLAERNPDLAAAMAHRITEFLRVRQRVSAPDRPPTPEEKRRLQALGYLTPGAQ